MVGKRSITLSLKNWVFLFDTHPLFYLEYEALKVAILVAAKLSRT
jgi:hypothetical protein